jgi:hypothetical protein
VDAYGVGDLLVVLSDQEQVDCGFLIDGEL